MLSADHRFDHLSDVHRGALIKAISFIRERFDPVGILVAGTIIRGEGHPNSDLDFAVVQQKPWRQRIQRFEDGVPVEIFVNPIAQWERTFTAEVRSGHPAMLGILSSGLPLYDPEGMLANLMERARTIYGFGPEIEEEHLTSLNYNIAGQFEDAVDIESIDLERSNAFVVNALQQVARLRHLQADKWIPREKQLFESLAAIDPEAGANLRAVLAAPRDRWVEFAAPLITSIAGIDRFFAWESKPQPVEL